MKTHPPPPNLTLTPGYSGERERAREGKKERKKQGREKSSLSGAFFLPWGGQWSESEERKRNYLLQFKHHCNRGQKSLWSEWTSVCAALSWCGFDSAVSMFPVKQPWLCKALGDPRCIIFSHRLETTELHSWAFWGLSFVWLLLVKLLKKTSVFSLLLMQLFYLSSLLLPRILLFYFQVFVIWVSFAVRDFEQGFVIACVHFVCIWLVHLGFRYTLTTYKRVCACMCFCVSLTNSRPTNS